MMCISDVKKISTQDHRLPTVTAVVVPPDVQWNEVSEYAMKK